MQITKLKTEAKDGNVNKQEVVVVLDNYIQISGFVLSFDENGEFSSIDIPTNIEFLDKEFELKMIADLINKLSALMQAAPEAFEEGYHKGSKFGKYVESYQDKILHHKYK